MVKLFIHFFFFIIALSVIFGKEDDYYWREYKGAIPSDAIVGGHESNGENIYIGQAYVHARGLIVVQINPGIKEVKAPIKGVKNVSRYIKILCGHKENFAWLPTNSTSLHVSLMNKHAVIGGHEDKHGSVYIGRITYEGGEQIGKINAFSVGNAQFRWADINNKESVATKYEVLIYQEQKTAT